MRNVESHRREIVRRIREKGCVLMLDFDGTLAPIVPHHGRAALEKRTRIILEKLSQKTPVAVISGRSLADIRARVRIAKISYAGSHGLEIHMAHPHAPIRAVLPRATKRTFHAARQALAEIAVRYPRVRIEDKGTSFAVHYRRLASAQRSAFLREGHIVMKPYVRTGEVRIIDDLATFDLMPHSGRTKGDCALKMFRCLRETRSAVPIFIGDGRTDEDAFRALDGGITIRIGRSRESVAHFYLASRGKLNAFLADIAALQSSIMLSRLSHER